MRLLPDNTDSAWQKTFFLQVERVHSKIVKEQQMHKPVRVIYYHHQVLCTVHNCMCCTFIRLPASPQHMHMHCANTYDGYNITRCWEFFQPFCNLMGPLSYMPDYCCSKCHQEVHDSIGKALHLVSYPIGEHLV